MRRCLQHLIAAALLAASLPTLARDTAEIARGRYLAQAGDCESCHTDRGGKPFTGGRAIATPFGTIYSRNITPDAATGIGDWSEEDFYRAMHEGLDREGQHLYPAFPYPWFTKLSRVDVHSIKVYLDTLPPVSQTAPPNEMALPLRWRTLIGTWNRLFFDAGEFRADPGKSAAWNRGAYLVEGAAHCGACHSPKNIAGATRKKRAFQGGMGEDWLASDLTGRALGGLSEWSIDEIAAYLKTGANERSRAAGPMAEVIEMSTSHLTKEDARSIATYLKDLPDGASAVPEEQSASVSDNGDSEHDRGRSLYLDNCTGCHMENGAGKRHVFPALKGSALTQAKNPATAIRLILGGGAAASTARNRNRFAMPAFAAKLDDDELAELMSYLRQAWGNAAADVSRGDVAGVRKQMQAQAPPPTN
jgi:mono/diheme cytochrome c family protein